MTQEWVLAKADTYPPKIAGKARAAATAHTDMMKNALKIGVLMAFGTDAAVYPHGKNAEEFGDLVARGGQLLAQYLVSTTAQSEGPIRNVMERILVAIYKKHGGT